MTWFELRKENKKLKSELGAYKDEVEIWYRCPHCLVHIEGEQAGVELDPTLALEFDCFSYDYLRSKGLLKFILSWPTKIFTHDCSKCGAILRFSPNKQNPMVETLHKPTKTWVAEQKESQ